MKAGLLEAPETTPLPSVTLISTTVIFPILWKLLTLEMSRNLQYISIEYT